MNTDDLIMRLSADVMPVSRHSLHLKLLAGIAAGGALTAVLVIALGFRSDLPSSVHEYSFWMKLAYTVSLACISALAMVELSRPDARPGRMIALLEIPVILLTFLCTTELEARPVDDWQQIWLGQTWLSCPLLVLALAIPIFLGLVSVCRRLAPTRLRLAGGIAGMTAGASAAALYCFHCQETSAAFLLTWYSLGVLLAAVAGAALGPRLMRW